MKRKRGQYVVGQGCDFDNGNGLDAGHWYVIRAGDGKVMGAYEFEHFACQLAVALDKRDQKRLVEEMDRILREESQNE